MIAFQPSASETQAMTALRGFLLAIFPGGTTQFTGSITGTTLSTMAVLSPGTRIMGDVIEPGTYVVSAAPPGQYVVTPSQNATGARMWTGVPVVRGQVNRVPEPRQGDFIVMWPILRKRLSTNVDTYADVAFTGAIAGTTLTVSHVSLGVIAPGQVVFGAGVAPGTIILAEGITPGTYLVTPTQNVAETLMASGQELLMQPTELTVQIDVHGPNSADNAQLISTLFRDEWGTRKFAELGDVAVPIYADDPKQIPFTNGEQQVEYRWVVNAVMQINPTVKVPMQFAEELDISIIEVDGAYPA